MVWLPRLLLAAALTAPLLGLGRNWTLDAIALIVVAAEYGLIGERQRG